MYGIRAPTTGFPLVPHGRKHWRAKNGVSVVVVLLTCVIHAVRKVNQTTAQDPPFGHGIAIPSALASETIVMTRCCWPTVFKLGRSLWSLGSILRPWL